MCDYVNKDKGKDNMANNVKKANYNKKNANRKSFDRILDKGIERYDKTLKKLSKN